MQTSFASYKAKKQKRKNDICARMRQAKERKRLESSLPDYPVDLPDPLFTLTFVDHIQGKEWAFTLHKGKQCNSFRINVNGQPFRDGGWANVLAEIRKKRVRIQSMRH